MADIGYFAWDLAARHGDSVCVRDDRLELTYRQFAVRVDAFANQLRDRGAVAGDVVAIMLPNRVELLIAMMASWRIGAAATPVNPVFTEVEAAHQMADAGAVLVVNAGPDAPTGGLPAIGVGEMASAERSGPAFPKPAGDDLALLIYTSGSTGRPKGVMVDHDNLQFMGSSMARHLSLTPADHCLLILPLFHANAICASVLSSLLAGAQISITGRFSPARFLADVARLRPTYFSAVPTIYAMLVAQAERVETDLASLRVAVCGAAPISKELLDKAERQFGIVIVEGYGLTEGTCASTCNPVDGPRKLGTVGPALPGQEVAIMDEEGRILPAETDGEVVIRGPAVMRGYLGMPEETARTIVDGWLHSGDVGRLDADGYLTLVDRIKDMIIRGGENVYPKEIENALATHPAVLEAAVVGAPDQVYGEVPIAFVVTYPDAAVSESQLAAHLEDQLAKVKRPTMIHILDELPRNPVGKIDKPGLRRRIPAV
ncbi:class I adenylate-forming enzyme family protein [Tomitella biformata]|uniref:class I adenylate-forming enzyme family protein n=1 Tax=Tomitella biformata TaxID=630403 RepID=UPI0004667597|nr:AMP-binding protein [Tomitella biformata]